ncbi:MAG: hypothetical protein NTZ87_02910 [Candidatus Nomurabacteria bacterium]|nr:hypothetical protein [Candidatus Nomurabacteria bacterium]
MKTKIIYISTLVILCAGFFYLGWYEHKTAPNVKIDSTITSNPEINTSTISNEYDQYVLSLDSICPFVSTAFTGDCLDKQINKQKQQYNLLSKEILAIAKTEIEKAKAQNVPYDLESYDILSALSAYNKTRDNYIEQLCSLKLASVTGTAIIEEARKCAMYYNLRDIQILENIKIDETKLIKIN